MTPDPGQAHGAAPVSGAHAEIWLPWIVRLRWVAAAGQVCAIVVARAALGLDIPVGWLLLVAAATGVSNGALVALLPRLSKAPVPTVTSVLALDVVLLTALLALSGGPANPFSVLYLVHVALAAVVLGVRSALGIATLSAIGYASLFVLPGVSGLEHALHGPGAMTLHLAGMWIATAAAAGIIGLFVAQIVAALRRREAQVRALERTAARAEKLVSLSTLAAGAAHELATPLGTIAVAAGELTRRLSSGEPGPAAKDDARLILEEVARCREILSRMQAGGGGTVGEGPEPIDVIDLLSGVREELRPFERDRLRIERCPETLALRAPRRAIVQSLVSLVRNALLATPAPGSVVLRAGRSAERVRFEVVDEGAGMTHDVLERAGEPFFTTRAPGEGMGLGIFLARAVAEQLGGAVRLESQPGRGTRALFEVDVDAVGGVGE
ncbi:MAG: HAMP domain-containing histidine kinase [Deltaproteobacteria bacterium]|nr:HAMP domain-containing histidine kinase [Deltaproteobacteria bacterium]